MPDRRTRVGMRGLALFTFFTGRSSKAHLDSFS